MDDVEAVQVGDPTDDLLEVLAGLELIDFGALDDVVEQLPLLNVLHDKEQVPTRLDYLVELDDGGVPDQL